MLKKNSFTKKYMLPHDFFQDAQELK